MERLANHGHGIALVFARTETKAFFRHVWPKASAMLFVRGRLTFHRPDGTTPKIGHNSGGPSVLIGYGPDAAVRLLANSDIGAIVSPGTIATSEQIPLRQSNLPSLTA